MTAPVPQRLLVRGVNWLGDAVMTTPALQRLREALPGAQVALLTATKLADLWKAHPAVDEILTFDAGESPWRLGRRLRAGQFDTALILPNSPRSAFEAFFAGIPRRLGVARFPRSWFLTEAIPPRKDAVRMRKPSVEEVRTAIDPTRALGPRVRPPAAAHHLHDYLHLAARLGASSEPLAPRLEVTAEELAAVRAKFGIPAGPDWIALNPGAEYGPAKRWPAERFVAVARQIGAEFPSARWLVLGGRNDQTAATEIAGAIPGSQNLAGRTSLRELMAVLAATRAVVTNDTGPMHLAAALGTPVVVPFGSTSPELTGPGLPGDPRHRLIVSDAPCSPCFLRHCPIDFRCLLGIPAERVAMELRKVLGTPGEQPLPRA